MIDELIERAEKGEGAEPVDGTQDRRPLAHGEMVVAPDGNVGFIVNLWSKYEHRGWLKGACVEFREDWRVDYPVSQLRRPLPRALKAHKEQHDGR